jgi:hypothetical protein
MFETDPESVSPAIYFSSVVAPYSTYNNIAGPENHILWPWRRNMNRKLTAMFRVQVGKK